MKRQLVDYKELATLLDSVVKIKERLTNIGNKLDTDYEASGEPKLVPLINGIFNARDCIKEAETYLSNI